MYLYLSSMMQGINSTNVAKYVTNTLKLANVILRNFK